MAEHEENVDPRPFFGSPLTVSDRAGLIVFSMVLEAIAAWMFWIVQNFLDARGWGAFAARLVLHDLVFSISLVAVGLAIYAAFLPRWLERFLTFAFRKLHSTIAMVAVLFALTGLVFLFVLPLLVHFGLIK